MKATGRSLQLVAPGALMILVGMVLISSGCTEFAPGISQEPLPTESAARQASNTLAPGDIVSLAFPGAPGLNLRQKVQANGSLSLPMIGDVSAAGRSVTSLQRDLERRYRVHLQNPEVVVVMEQAAAAVYVSGQVIQPAKIPLDRPMTALEAVMETGGFAPTANPRKVTVMRIENGQRRRYDLNLEGRSSGGAFYLKPYDIVHVSERFW